MMKRIIIKTSKKHEVVDITTDVSNIVKESGVKQGLCSIYSRHTTAAIIINENDDPKIRDDILDFLGNLVRKGVWGHDVSGRCDRANGDAHLKASLIGESKMVPIEDGKLMLGTWQNIFFCEFDGPREGREIIVTIIKNE